MTAFEEFSIGVSCLPNLESANNLSVFWARTEKLCLREGFAST